MLPEVHERELVGLSDEALRNRLREIAADSVAYKNKMRDTELERERIAADLDAVRREQAQAQVSWEAERERMFNDLAVLRDDTGGNATVVDQMTQENNRLKKQLDFLSRDYTKLQELSTQVDAGAHQRLEQELKDMTEQAIAFQQVADERDAQLIAAVEENEDIDAQRFAAVLRAEEAEKRAEVERTERANAAAAVKTEPVVPGAGVFPDESETVSTLRAELQSIRKENTLQKQLYEKEMTFMRKTVEQSMSQVQTLITTMQSNAGSPVSGGTPAERRSVAGSRDPSPSYVPVYAVGESNLTTRLVSNDSGRGFADVNDKSLPKSEIYDNTLRYYET
jgi:hypothetical protein